MPGNQLLQIAVGSVLAFAGVATIVIAATGGRRRRGVSLWFGIFTALYAVRLLVRVVALDEFLGINEGVADFVNAGITYLILAPGVAAGAEILDPRGPLLRRLWQADLLYGLMAVGIDAGRGAGSMLWLNAPAVSVNVAILIVTIGRTIRRLQRTPGLVAAFAGLTLFMLTAGYETYAGAADIAPPVRIEPLGMLAFISGLGYLVAERLIAAERQRLAMSQEMDTARRIQRSILPGRVPEVPGLAVDAHLLPMTRPM